MGPRAGLGIANRQGREHGCCSRRGSTACMCPCCSLRGSFLYLPVDRGHDQRPQGTHPEPLRAPVSETGPPGVPHPDHCQQAPRKRKGQGQSLAGGRLALSKVWGGMHTHPRAHADMHTDAGTHTYVPAHMTPPAAHSAAPCPGAFPSRLPPELPAPISPPAAPSTEDLLGKLLPAAKTLEVQGEAEQGLGQSLCGRRDWQGWMPTVPAASRGRPSTPPARLWLERGRGHRTPGFGSKLSPD